MLAVLLIIVLVIVVAGVFLWGLTQLPVDPTLANVARVVIIVAVVIICAYEVYALVAGPVAALDIPTRHR